MNRQQFRVLYREFLFRIVDLELLAPQGDITKLLGQFAALLIVISIALTILGVGTAAAVQSIPDQSPLVGWAVEHLLVSTTMLVVGLFAVLSWDSTFPDRRDVLVLSPLPLRARTLFLAKVAAVATSLCLTVVALNSLTGIFGPLVFSGASTAVSPQYDPAIPPVGAATMQNVLDRDMRPALAPGGAIAAGTDYGVAIGILNHGERRVFAYGTANPDSIFEIGSISKTFTGLILSRMVLQGRVRLEQPVRELLPPGLVKKPAGPEITLLDLITHHSGLPRMPDNFSPADLTNPYADYLTPNLWAYLNRHGVARPRNPLYLYSNLGVGLLGQVLAVRAGTTYAKLLQEEVTGPLGLSDTTISFTPDQRARFIQGHRRPKAPQRGWDLGALQGAGAIRSTAGDLLTYLDAQLHPGKFPALTTAIEQTHGLRAVVRDQTQIALAWNFDRATGLYAHDGGTGGYTSRVLFNPTQDYTVVVLLNTSGLASFLTGYLGDHIRQRFEGKPAVRLIDPVVPGRVRFASLVRSYTAYWVSAVAAGTFIFCCVLSLQGLAQLLPRQAFLRVSSLLQMIFFVALVSVYVLQPGFSEIDELVQNEAVLRWLPSYWFFGTLQSMRGPMPQELDFLWQRAWIGFGIAVLGAAAAYLICYLRTLRKIAEQPDILPSVRGLRALPPFGGSFETALGHFAVRTLLRSRQHRVILSFYLGIALGLGLFISKAPVLSHQSAPMDIWYQVNVPLLVSSMLMMCAAVMGMRVVFDMPLDIRANWIFRVLPLPGVPACLGASRRCLYALATPAWGALAVLLFWLWPWRMAVEHLVLLALLALIVAELRLSGFHKLPFTCSYQPGKAQWHMKVLAFGLLMFVTARAAELEKDALSSPITYAAVTAALIAAAVLARLRAQSNARSEAVSLAFDDPPEPAVQSLGLYRDGVLPIEVER